MNIYNLTSEQESDYRKRLLECVPASGFIRNIALLRDLDWPESVYWVVRDELIDAGALEAVRGRGGSVRRRSPKEAALPATDGESDRRNALLHAPVLTTLRRNWAQDFRYGRVFAEITAQQRRGAAGSEWSRPDITLAAYDSYAYIPGECLDVITFEVRRSDSVDVTAVHKALAHRRTANYSYLLISRPAALPDSSTYIIEEVSREASLLGIGLVVFEDAGAYRTWDFRLEAERNEPDRAALNEFLSEHISQVFKEQIGHWRRQPLFS